MAINSTIDSFKEYDLFPSLYEQIDRAFPELHFMRKGNRWESKYHLNGTKDSQNKVISFVYGNTKFMAIDHATNEKKGLIDLYMSLNGKDFITALEELAKICNLTLPNSYNEEWKEYERKQADKEKALAAFTTALWEDTEEAKSVRSYLSSRKWTEAQVKEAELGLITTEIRNGLSDGDSYRYDVRDNEGKTIGGIGTTHLLVIPYRNGSRLLGFKFREVSTPLITSTKYLNSRGLSKGNGLCGIGIGVKDLVIVESELDALHAKVMGADNVAATAGTQATETQIQDAVRRGVEKFTLLFDNDESGRKFVKPTIEAIQRAGGSIYVATLPDGIKDLDEYLASHTIEDYKKNVVGAALSYSLYLVYDIVSRYAAKEETNGVFTLKDREDFFSEVERLLNSDYIKPYEREDIYKRLEEYEPSLNFKVSDFREWTDRAYLRKQEANRAEAVQEASTKIQEAIVAGRTDEALKLMRVTAAEQSAQERAIEYAKVFASSTPQEYATFLSEIREGIPTGIKFQQGRQQEEFTLNAGLTFICGYRGHGKTSFLNNIALNEAKRNVALGNGKSVLYFSYEVDKRRLIIDLLNTFINDAEISRTPSDTILSYFKGRGAQYFKNERRADGSTHYENFVAQKNKFLSDYLSSGALVIADENYKVEKLLDAIKYYLSMRSTSIVCIDYAQLIYSEEYSRQRTEEIKKVVNDIKDFANREGIPFVLAAQFNREVDSPVSVDTKNIGEGGDFERIADTCIGLFNLKELHPLPKNKEEEKETKKLLSDLGAATYQQGDSLKPIQGKLFVRLMKRRYGYYPLDTILEWEGRTKYIKPNFEEALSTQAKQGGLFNGDSEASDFGEIDLKERDEPAPF